jgi:hypothetical protein
VTGANAIGVDGLIGLLDSINRECRNRVDAKLVQRWVMDRSMAQRFDYSRRRLDMDGLLLRTHD